MNLLAGSLNFFKSIRCSRFIAWSMMALKERNKKRMNEATRQKKDKSERMDDSGMDKWMASCTKKLGPQPSLKSHISHGSRRAGQQKKSLILHTSRILQPFFLCNFWKRVFSYCEETYSEGSLAAKHQSALWLIGRLVRRWMNWWMSELVSK